MQLVGSAWGSGVNLYMTVAGLGILQRMGMVNLPGKMDAVSSLPVIIIASSLYLVEFAADKVPYVDSTWDSVHTFIRPLGGAILAYMGTSNFDPAAQIPIALLSGGVSMESHLAKSSSRAAINTSPEPISNSAASLTEDGLVAGMLYLITKHPVIATVVGILFKFVKKFFLFSFGKEKIKEDGK